MANLIFVITALFCFLAFSHSFTIGMVCTGLLILFWNRESELTKLRAQIEALGKKISHLQPLDAQERSAEQTAQKTAQQSSAAAATDTSQAPPAETETANTDLQSATAEESIAEIASLGKTAAEPAAELTTKVIRAADDTVQHDDNTAQPSKEKNASVLPADKPVIVASTPAEPPKPRQPTVFDKLIAYAWNWLTDGNAFVKIGVSILFIGMSFLVRYAIDKNIIPIEIRLLTLAAAAMALLVFGWRQRDKRQTFSLVVQGAGIATLYLTVFAGFSFYKVIPSAMAFVLLFAFVALAAILAIQQNAKSLALFATVGGFVAPILTSTGSNNYIGLFSYYALLNIGIVFIAWKRAWRILNFTGFLFTFAISTIWGVLSYQPENFATVEPFLVLFFLLYVAVSILFATRTSPFYKNYVDSSLIFGTPLLGFALQCAMVKDFQYGIAISALALGAFYLALALLLWKRYATQLKLLCETFLSLGVVFVTLAVPFTVDGDTTGATWALEGVGILWVSIRQQQYYRRLFGLALIGISALILGFELLTQIAAPDAASPLPFINSAFIGALLICLSASVAGWLLSRGYPDQRAIEKKFEGKLLYFGMIILLLGFQHQIAVHHLYAKQGVYLAMLAALGSFASVLASIRGRWHEAGRAGLIWLAPLAAAALICFSNQAQLAEHAGYPAWTLSLLLVFTGLKLATRHFDNSLRTLLFAGHLLITAVVAGLLFWEGLWQLLLGYSLLAVLANELLKRTDWQELKAFTLGFLPVLVAAALIAIMRDGNLVALSNTAASYTLPFAPGGLLWPLAFAVYFYILYHNPVIRNHSTSPLQYGGALLIGLLLMWLGNWPLLLGATLLCALAQWLWQRLQWAQMQMVSQALLPVMLLTSLFVLLGADADPFALQARHVTFAPPFEIGYALWPLAFAAWLWLLKCAEKQAVPVPALSVSVALLLAVALSSWETSWHLLDMVRFNSGWHVASLPLFILAAMALVTTAPCWPFSAYQDSLKSQALPVLTTALVLWLAGQLLASGGSTPLLWLPLLNPTDLIMLLTLMLLWLWHKPILHALPAAVSTLPLFYLAIGYLFVWANVDILRAMHHWFGVNWNLGSLLRYDLSQTVLSLFWAICGLAGTLYSGRRSERKLWLGSAALLAAVVVKLMLVDMSASDTVERIISFIGVGLLLTLVGYFSPLPPKPEQASEEQTPQPQEPTENAQ